MPERIVTSIIFLFLLFPVISFPQQRTLEISGLKIFSQEELMGLLNLDRYEKNEMSAKEVIDSIIAFYGANGFTIMKVYVIDNSENLLSIYVDEGALGKVIFLNVDDFTTIYLKLAFQVKHNIFNIYGIQENIDKFRKTKRFSDMRYQLKPVAEFDRSPFQLDQELQVSVIEKKQLPFFERFSPRYDLVIYQSKTVVLDKLSEQKLQGDSKTPASKKPAGKKRKKPVTLNKFNYGFKVHYYKGFIPYLKYYHLNLLSGGDFFMAETSVGVMYGFDRQFDRLPRLTYINFNMNYFFTPTFKEVFTPHLRIDLYNSKTARPDLGLLKYNFLALNAMLAPGFTFLRKFNIYTGLGVETVFFYNSQSGSQDKLLRGLKLMQFNPADISFGHDPAKDIDNFNYTVRLYREIEKRIDVYGYLEIGAVYDFSKKSTKIYELRKNRLKKEIAFAYNFYFLKKTFHRVRVIGSFDHEFKDRSIYSGMLFYQYLFKDPPFYQEVSVTNPAFKGLNRKAYMSRHCLSQSNEYRVSVYKDFFYVGLFLDLTLFDGSGRDVKQGAQFAFAGGPTARILILDSFEIYLQYGWDYLLSTKKSSGYFYFNVFNKW